MCDAEAHDGNSNGIAPFLETGGCTRRPHTTKDHHVNKTVERIRPKCHILAQHVRSPERYRADKSISQESGKHL